MAWGYGSLGVEVSSDRAPVRSCLRAVRADSAGLVSWLSSVSLAHASVRWGSSGLSLGTGLIDIMFPEAAYSLIGAALTSNVGPVLTHSGSGAGLLPSSQNKAASSSDISTYPSK